MGWDDSADNFRIHYCVPYVTGGNNIVTENNSGKMLSVFPVDYKLMHMFFPVSP